MKSLRKLQEEAHKNAVEKGFWHTKCDWCKGKGGEYTKSEDYYDLKIWNECAYCNGRGKIRYRNSGELIALIHSELSECLEDLRKNDWEGAAEEMADVVIRALDFCEGYGIDLQKEIVKKMSENKKRAYKHGKKF